MIESTAIKPQLCRVSVIGGNTQVDVVLPTTIPIANFIPDVVQLIASRNPDLSEHDENGPLTAQHWTLSRLGHNAIDPVRTLTDAEVFDGELLVLRAVDSVEAPALFDDVIDAVARLTESSFRGWTSESAGWAGMAGAIAAAAGACLMLLVAAAHGSGILAGAAGLGVGLLTLAGAALVARMYSATLPATVLALCGLLLMGTGAAALVPGEPGAPHLLLGCAATVLLAVITLRVIGVHPAVCSAVITVGVFGTAAAGVTTIWQVDPSKAAAGIIVATLLGITLAPRIAVAAARLPVPPVPTAGGVIDPRDHEPRPTIEGIGAIGATSIPSAAGLGERSRLANDYQTGMIIGIVAVTVCATIMTVLNATEHRWQTTALAAAVGLVLARRGRAFSDLTQAAAMVLGGCAALIPAAVLLGIRLSDATLPAAGALLVIAALAMLIGVAGPNLEISPVVQRAGEIVEYLTICAIGPLIFWILDIYALARNG
ncbi:type VII secretion integral membrane protein EccD [Nocardia sp. NBC_01503]|uniref:type VII secretion integral membrane protein EccD n=1 Tax=Nocardia sp. NBC_01503 TaxID=2975997 RepID=UPI002E7B9C4D|nr:type VII secretion integral membrane protein EccD [Nocardia sp. NBC_01503]WTL29582.1 type VII secretion integral membrane protein EccD [Nocardia sp. NBC_01503]